MSIAIDTNILFDILLPDPVFKESSLELLQKYSTIEKLVISEIVYAELAQQFNGSQDLDKFLLDTNICLTSISREGLWLASQAWKKYLYSRDGKTQCSNCGHKEFIKCGDCSATIKTRQHILSDFLIAGHALVEGGKLLSRDRGFYRGYFAGLEVVY